MGDNCDPNNCARCDKYALMEAAYLADIQNAPHFNDAQKQSLTALFQIMPQDRKRAVLRGFELFQVLRKRKDLTTKARTKVKNQDDFKAFAAYYKAAMGISPRD